MLIRLDKVSKRFGKTTALQPTSFNLERGQSYGLIGPNGSGKTTLLSLLSGYHKPSTGEIHMDEIRLGAYVGMTGFFEHLTAFEWLTVLSELSGFKEPNYLSKSLHAVGLNPDNSTKIKNFSFGMKQRLGIASAIFNKPAFIMFDEPLNGLDPEGIIMFKNLIQSERNRFEDLCTVISSHRIDDLITFCDNLIILKEGEAVFKGTTEEFKSHGADNDSAYLELTNQQAV